MIRVLSLTIHEFRGIRDLTLNLAGENFAVCGPNGTGKSGIVDALEFGLTGSISRLAGDGTGGLSVTDHGPHVDRRNNPEDAYVEVALDFPGIGQTATLRRTVKDRRNPTVTPSTDQINSVLAYISSHPEFALSRREIIRYVLCEPGRRAKEVGALLRLHKIESLRATLQKIANSTDRDVTNLVTTKRSSAENLTRVLAITKLSSQTILDAANAKRLILGLPAIPNLDATTSLKDGLLSASAAMKPPKVPKAQAVSEIALVLDQIKAFQEDAAASDRAILSKALSDLLADEAALQLTTQEDMLRTALSSFNESTCPVCDTGWQPDEFRAHVEAKLAKLATVSEKRADLVTRLDLVAGSMRLLRDRVVSLTSFGEALDPKVETPALDSFAKHLEDASDILARFLPLAETCAAVEAAADVPSAVLSEIGSLAKAIGELPEPTIQDAARDFLVAGNERLETYRQDSLRLQAAQEQQAIAREVLSTYGSATTSALEGIYKQVQGRFIALYRRINHTDENEFEAKLAPSLGKLGFDVDFYGRGFFPPGAYHSEGHQDGMGLCLYLALMSHLSADGFTFAVLDDVLMSVDTGHRREVSRMLIDEFPNTQFVLTTHDDVWLRYMRTSGLIEPKQFARFRNWTVDTGPTEWDDRDVWEEIKLHLAKNDIVAASAALRNYLEYFGREACDGMRASVPFRGDASYSLEDLLPNAVKKLKSLLKAGRVAAESWSQQEKASALSANETSLQLAVDAAQVDRWQVNAAVHYNEWARLSREEFGPVVEAYRSLCDQFRCKKCSGTVYVEPHMGESQSLRCGCMDLNVNLVKKPATLKP